MYWKSVGITCLLLMTSVQGVLSTNYCDTSLCYNGKHIACGHSMAFSSLCHKASMLPMGEAGQVFILKMHNQLRSRIASGLVPGFQGAVRMQTLQWDPELAVMAELNAKQCTMAHDECRNTDQFRWAGQNLGIFYTTGKTIDTSTIVGKLINEWFAEYQYASQADVDIIKPRDKNAQAIGHFTALVQEKSGRVGCAISSFETNMNGRVWTALLLACDYSFTNLIGAPAYRSGRTCSECTSGCSNEYSGLCNPSESVSPNP